MPLSFLFIPRLNAYPSMHVYPEKMTQKQQRLLDDVIASWVEEMPESQASNAIDFEDWFENAYRLYEAKATFPERDTFVLRRFEGEHLITLKDDLQDKASLQGKDVFLLGMHCRAEDTLEEDFGLHPVNLKTGPNNDVLYAGSETFQKHAGRTVTLCDAVTDDIEKAIADLRTDGHEKAFLKVNRSKYGIEVISTEPGEFIGSDTAWAIMHLEGDKNAFQVQAYTDMYYEYRFIVVGHKLVAGAACIEEFTPLDNKGTHFDGQLRYHRQSETPVIHDEQAKQVLNVLKDAAATFVTEMKEEDTFAHYTLDMALDREGKPLVVECNDLNNYGLYAMHYPAILREQVAFYDNKLELAVKKSATSTLQP